MALTSQRRLRSWTGLGRAITILAVPLVAAACLSATVSTYALQTYTSADGRFRVDVPGGQMTEALVPGSGPLAGSPVHALTLARDGLRFGVAYGDAEAAHPPNRPVEAALEDAVQAQLHATHGGLTEEHAVTVGGRPAREARIAIIGGEYVFVVLFVDNRLYSLSVLGTDDSAARGSEATAYLQSFALIP